jgi:hypothetical protein
VERENSIGKCNSLLDMMEKGWERDETNSSIIQIFDSLFLGAPAAGVEKSSPRSRALRSSLEF